MELKIKTCDLRSMVDKAIKCSSNNKLIPLTSLMNIKVSQNVLSVTTTDATNYFYAYAKDKVNCEDFEISVVADLFTKLIQKTTSDFVELKLEDNVLKIKGNGVYTMALPLDENGSVIKFPVKDDFKFGPNTQVIKETTIQTILATNKAALAISVELPSLTAYYCGDKVVTSDSYKICSTAIKVFDKPMLITASLMELLGVLDTEDINVSISDKNIMFRTPSEKIYAPIAEGIDTFPIDAINGLLDQEFVSKCVVPRAAILSVIDRLCLFVSPYDKKGIYLTFTPEGLMLSSKKSSGTETVPYMASENFQNYTCLIDVEMFKSQIATQSSEKLELYYGSSTAIKTVNNNITQIIALMEDDRVAQE